MEFDHVDRRPHHFEHKFVSGDVQDKGWNVWTERAFVINEIINVNWSFYFNWFFIGIWVRPAHLFEAIYSVFYFFFVFYVVFLKKIYVNVWVFNGCFMRYIMLMFLIIFKHKFHLLLYQSFNLFNISIEDMCIPVPPLEERNSMKMSTLKQVSRQNPSLDILRYEWYPF